METKKTQYKYINDGKILFEFEEDLDIFEELVEDYQARFHLMTNEIKSGIQNKSSEEVRIAAHTLKGVVANFYSDKLTQSAFQLENSSHEENWSDLQEYYDQFLKDNDIVLKEVITFINEQKSKSSEVS